MRNRGHRLITSAWLAVLTAGLAVAMASADGASPQADRPVWADRVDRLFASLDRRDTPGCALGVFTDGRMVYGRGYGSADLEHDVPITPDTVFYAGSVSKQFTAMAAALAINEGLFALDDDVTKLVPELPAYDAPIRVRHLVHHTSGLRDINTLVAVAGRRDDMAFDNDAVLRVLARQRALNFTPGAEHLYSNSGYAVLALMVERASKMSFAAYADARIFKPLGMTVTHFHTDLGRLVRNRAFAYDLPIAGGPRLNTPQNERAGAGGLYTSIRELLLWDENFYTGRVGGRDIIAQLETPGRLSSGAVTRYAWGLQSTTYRGVPVIEHSGALGGYRAQTFRVREQHFSVAVLCNLSSANPTELSRRVADICLEGRFKEAVPAGAPASPASAAKRAAGPAYTPGELAAFTGIYGSDELETTYRIALDATGLTLRRGVEKQAIALQAVGPDEFRAQSATLRFLRGDGRNVTGLVLDAGRVRGIAFALMRGSSGIGSLAAPAPRATVVTIEGDRFFINGRPTLEGRAWRGHKVEGLLPNSRMVQGTFDDLNADTRGRFAYSDTGVWDADRNTREFVAAMAEWRRHGLLAFTLNLQGGSPEGYSQGQPWHNSAFGADGSLRLDYLARLTLILDEADRLGMAVVLGLFYFGQDERLRDEAAVIRAVDSAVAWVLNRGYANVLIEINNECDIKYDHAILRPPRVHELIARAREAARGGRRLLVSTSYGGSTIPSPEVVAASDYVLLHGNGVSDPKRIAEMVALTRALPTYTPKPVVFNEDDHYDFDKPANNFLAATSAYASWGFFDFRRKGEAAEEGFQSVPVNWGVSSARKRAFFETVRDMSGRQ